jgi:hypothetical protein
MTQSSMYNGSEYQLEECSYTNEGQLHRALLPARFQSTSTPDYVGGETINDTEHVTPVLG